MLEKNIKELRTKRGYTQARLAKEIGVTQGAVYFWEKEINEPTAEYLVKLAKFFGVTLGELLSSECDGAVEETRLNAEVAILFNKLSTNQKNIIINIIKETLRP